MRKILVMARREYQATVRTKAFIITVVLMPVFMFGAIFIQTFLAGRGDVSEKKVVVLDGTGRLFEPLQTLVRMRNDTELVDKSTGRKSRPPILLEPGPAGPVTDELRLALSERIRRNEIFAFVEIDADALRPNLGSRLAQLLGAAGKSDAPLPEEAASPPPPVRIYTESMIFNEIGRWFVQAVYQAAIALRLQESRLDPAVVAGAVSPVDVVELGLYSRTDKGEIHKADEGTRSVTFFVPVGIIMLMFTSVMVVGQPMLTSVLEEKQQRIAEVLLGSASPFQIMMGKLTGNVGVALTIVALYVGGGYFVAAYYGYSDLVPLRLLGWFIAFQVLAGLLYGAIFISIGAACTEIKESQSLLMPVMLLLVMPLMVWFNVVREPLSSFSTWVSLFPPATPMLMMLRMAASPMVPWWQPVLGMALVLATTVACVFAAGRVFRIGLLSQGKAPKLRELIQWIAHG